MQGFYTALKTSQNALYRYQEECAKWEETYGKKTTKRTETLHERIQRYKEKDDRQNTEQPYKSRDKGAR